MVSIARKIEVKSQNTIALIGNSVVAQNFIWNGGSITGWLPATAKNQNDVVVPESNIVWPYAHLSYKATAVQGDQKTAATYGGEPNWPQTVGATVQDNNVTWTAQLRTDSPAWPFSWWNFAQMLSGQRFTTVFIGGYSGQVSTTVNSRLAAALNANPDYVWFGNWFENDTWPAVAPTLSTILAAWTTFQAAVDAVRVSGKIPFLTTVCPNANIDSSSLFTGYAAGNGTKAWHWLNIKIREYARKYRNQVLFCDLAHLWVDPNVANPVYPENTATYLSQSGSGQQLKKTDGVHLNRAAAWLCAQALANTITSSIPFVDHFGTGALNAYDLEPNPINYGSAGTVSGTGASGSAANLMTLTNWSTGTLVGSLVARTDGYPGQWQRAEYTAAAADNVAFYWTSTKAIGTTPFSIGDSYEMLAEVRVSANPTLLTSIYCYADLSAGTPRYNYSGQMAGTEQDLGQFITADTTFILRTPPVPVMPSTNTFQGHVRAYGRGAATFTVDFGRRTFRKTITPDIS